MHWVYPQFSIMQKQPSRHLNRKKFEEVQASLPPSLACLSQFDCSPDARLTIVLAGAPERISLLGDPLLERAELRIDVAPWAPDDTENYLKASLARAGRQAPVFVEPAIERLHQLAQGIPRRITQLADLALLAGAGRELDHIDAETIESVYRELGVIEV